MFEFLFEIFGEFLLQVFGELLFEYGFRFLAAPFEKRPHPWIAAAGYVIFGLLLGALSLLVFPHNFVPRPWRLANLLLTPLAVGAAMSLLGAWREGRGQRVLRIDRFAWGYLFALAVAVVRFLFAD